MTKPTPTLNLNAPLETHDGRKVRIISTEGVEPYVLVGYIDQDDQPSTWKADGSYAAPTGFHTLDLRNVAPAPRIKYVNIYRDGLAVYESREAADYHATPGRIGCQRITLISGTWDD